MSILKRTFNHIAKSIEISGRNRVRSELLTMGEAKLRELGFSSEELNKGVDAWPWRIEEASEVTSIQEVNHDVTLEAAPSFSKAA